jgi:hypothetical protein
MPNKRRFSKCVLTYAKREMDEYNRDLIPAYPLLIIIAIGLTLVITTANSPILKRIIALALVWVGIIGTPIIIPYLAGALNCRVVAIHNTKLDCENACIVRREKCYERCVRKHEVIEERLGCFDDCIDAFQKCAIHCWDMFEYAEPQPQS